MTLVMVKFCYHIQKQLVRDCIGYWMGLDRVRWDEMGSDEIGLGCMGLTEQDGKC